MTLPPPTATQLDDDLAGPELGAILRTALDAAVVMRVDGTVAGWNQAAELTFGWSYAEARGRAMSELIVPPEMRARHDAGLQRYLRTGEGPVLNARLEMEALCKNGSRVPVELSVTVTEQRGERVFLGFMRDISARRAHDEAQRTIIMEMHHRVKNLLGVVAGVANLTVRSSETLGEFDSAFTGRLQALARAHEILSDTRWEAAPLRALMQSLLGGYTQGAAPRVECHGQEVLVSSRIITGVSMIVHELLTNAVKYGALGAPGGKVCVEWTLLPGKLELLWREHADLRLTTPAKSGFGTRMIAAVVRGDLRGEHHWRWRSCGVELAVTFPVKADAEGGVVLLRP